MIPKPVCGIIREQSMLYKNNILKYSFLSAGLAYLLTSTAFAQSPLDGTETNSLPALSLENSAPEERPLVGQDDDGSLNPGDSIAPAEGGAPVNGENQLNGGDEALLPQGGDNTEIFAAPENVNDPLFAGDNNGDELANNDGFDNQNANELSKEEENDNVLKAYNNFVDKTDRQAFENNNATFGDKIMDQVKEDLFSQMADIEKQTSLLTLELKREKIKNEIAAMHAARQKAIEEEKEKQLEKERRQKEWEKEQEKKLLEEKQKLKETEIKFEKLRQERVLKAYKESMLKTNQEWVEYNARLYNQLVKEEKEQNDLIAKHKEYFGKLTNEISGLVTTAQQTKEKYNREIANLQTQVAILKSKLEAEKNAFEESKKSGPNPFALVEEDANSPKQKVSEEYAIMEISGKGENLVAKLINKNGGTFMVKPGTVLNTGHVIEEITQTYIVVDKSGIKDYLYFSAGGILDKEPTKTINATPKASVSSKDSEEESESPTVPSLREGMFVE